MTMITTFKFYNFVFVSNPLASRIADIVASVPDEVNLTCSTEFTCSFIISERIVSPSVGAPKLNPFDKEFFTAEITSSFACPTIAGPQEQIVSTYRLPSTSYKIRSRGFLDKSRNSSYRVKSSQDY